MKIAIMGDTHLGYARFEEDSYIQAEWAIKDAEDKADLIIIAGDVFDTKIPRMETLQRALNIFKKIKKRIITIHGNHERRSKDSVNILQILDTGGFVEYLHNQSLQIEENGEKINIIGLGSVPSFYSKTALKVCTEKNGPKKGYFNILVLHQNFNELSMGEEDLSFEDIQELNFDLIINGHIHKHHNSLNGKLIIPGSTVVTQLKKEETEARGYVLYDTEKKEGRFIPVKSRDFYLEELEFENAGILEVRKAVEEKIEEIKKRSPESIIKIRLKGKIMDGLSPSDLVLRGGKNIFIDNKLNIKNLRQRLDEIKAGRKSEVSVRDYAMKKLKEKTENKIDFDPVEFFEKLSESPDKAIKYLEE
ncbi:metallophosphoesterase [Candidatus Micrarchaeota archaeon]|nr:metallophosphoesterase [Candidatus Micrarchaeota archaeon]